MAGREREARSGFTNADIFVKRSSECRRKFVVINSISMENELTTTVCDDGFDLREG